MLVESTDAGPLEAMLTVLCSEPPEIDDGEDERMRCRDEPEAPGPPGAGCSGRWSTDVAAAAIINAASPVPPRTLLPKGEPMFLPAVLRVESGESARE